MISPARGWAGTTQTKECGSSTSSTVLDMMGIEYDQEDFDGKAVGLGRGH